MQTDKLRYEVLIRYDHEGTPSAAHQQYRYVTRDGGAVVGEFLGQAEPLALGFDLSGVMEEAQAAAVIAAVQARAERDAAIAERDAAISARDMTAASCAALSADLAVCQQERDVAVGTLRRVQAQMAADLAAARARIAELEKQA